jgi:hypothetical protein
MLLFKNADYLKNNKKQLIYCVLIPLSPILIGVSIMAMVYNRIFTFLFFIMIFIFILSLIIFIQSMTIYTILLIKKDIMIFYNTYKHKKVFLLKDLTGITNCKNGYIFKFKYNNITFYGHKELIGKNHENLIKIADMKRGILKNENEYIIYSEPKSIAYFSYKDIKL